MKGIFGCSLIDVIGSLCDGVFLLVKKSLCKEGAQWERSLYHRGTGKYEQGRRFWLNVGCLPSSTDGHLSYQKQRTKGWRPGAKGISMVSSIVSLGMPVRQELTP